MRLVALLLLAFTTGAHAQGSVAFFGLHLEDSSRQTTQTASLTPEGPLAEDLERKELLEALVAERFTQEGFELLDLGPVSDDLSRVSNPASCYGCDLRMAKALGADFILVGEINKVSTALVSISVQLRDGKTGEIVKGGSVSVRGSTDDLWLRGMRQVLNSRLFREEEQ